MLRRFGCGSSLVLIISTMACGSPGADIDALTLAPPGAGSTGGLLSGDAGSGTDPVTGGPVTGDATTGGDAPTTGSTAETGTGGPPPGLVGVDAHDVEVPGDLHVQGLSLRARLFVPRFDGAVGPLPAVMVLHGSGGLFRMPSDDDIATGRTCSAELEPQFDRWAQRLAGLGYVVLLPSSFCARGFCDYNDDTDRIPIDFDDDRERLLGRLYDTDASGRYLCDRPEVDCARMGLLGFSNGASTVLVSLHWQINPSLQEFAMSDGDELDMGVLPVPEGGPTYALGVAYYPGCGLNGLVSFGTDDDDPIEDMYFPASELFIEHATEDSLIDDCSAVHGDGRRQLQSAIVAAALGVEDRFHVVAHEGADHGFDNADRDDPRSDTTARDVALEHTLARFEAYLGD